MEIIPQVILKSSGRSMPLLGMGTANGPRVPSNQTKAAIIEAIRIGYRHFDTAFLYLTEQPPGEAIAEALSLGLIKSRDELFITTKLWCPDAHPHLVLPALHNSLKTLQLDYVDLYLIHWSVSSKSGINEFPYNFSCKKLSDILAAAEIHPAVNQESLITIGCQLTKDFILRCYHSDNRKVKEVSILAGGVNPLWQQKKLIEFCKKKGIVLTAYSPLGASGTMWGSNRVLTNQALNEIAISKGKSIPRVISPCQTSFLCTEFVSTFCPITRNYQICLRWGYEQGICVLVKSFNKERMEQNIDIFNWTLTNEEHEKIREIPQIEESAEDIPYPVQGL